VGYIEGMADAPGGVNETAAQVREVFAGAAVSAAAMNAQAAAFIAENGHDVVGGHGMVGSPGDAGSDPDTGGADAADQPRHPVTGQYTAKQERNGATGETK
jgi:hypothetical protein